MTKEDVSDLIQSALSDASSALNIDLQGYKVSFDDWTSKGVNHCGINTDLKIIACNIGWIESCIAADDDYDIPYLLMHEIRHEYQKREIEALRSGKPTNEPKVLIEKWDKEFKNYIWNDGTPLKESQNQCQSVEVDANAFAAIMMMKRNGNMEVRFHEDAFEKTIKRTKVLLPKYAPEIHDRLN